MNRTLPGVEAAPELVGTQTQRHASRRAAAHLDDLGAQLVQGEARQDELEIALDAVRCGERLKQARPGETANEASPKRRSSETQPRRRQPKRPGQPDRKHALTESSGIDPSRQRRTRASVRGAAHFACKHAFT